MSRFRSAARRIRHLPGIRRIEGLWRVFRKPYHWLLNSGGGGVEVVVGGKSAIRMPAEFAGGDWEQFEPETIDIFARWVRRHPGGLVLDVGSSLGIFSAVALFADSRVEVVAFDSDLASLAAARRVCEHASGKRLRLVYGFLGQTATESKPLAAAVTATDVALQRSGVRGDIGTTRFVCLTDPDVSAIPCRRLDDLFPAEIVERRPLLIKCDVEGAELLVLSGAENLLRRARPDLLLSVHPPALPGYGHSREGVREFLEGTGYDIRCVAVDHEEHWWCEYGPESLQSAAQEIERP